MSDFTRKIRIKKSRLINFGPYAQSWLGFEIEEEFPVSCGDDKTQQLIEEVNLLLDEEERRERNILQNKIDDIKSF